MVNSAKLQTKLDNSLAIYFKEIDSIPLMAREEEYELALKAKQGDIIARDKILKANLRFVVSVAKKYQCSAFELNDLINEGNIGLMIAIDKFDPEKGYHFISYAVWWIRQTILKAIYEKGKMIRLPSNKTNDIIKIEKARKSLKAKLSEEEELEQVAIMLNMTPLHVQEMMMISKDVFSLDSKVGGDEADSNSLGEMLEDITSISPEDNVIEIDMKEQIDNALSTLTEKEAEILRYRFGLNGKKSMSLKEVGEVFNLSKERIRQIEKKAIKRLQHPSRSSKLKAFIA
ncbi:MAG: RNA polymerase sigma factor RpoD/SigA [Treponemataceae bacterium]|jgi:RNA polymerase primary sigma factor|nr:RNA polymerase sigma factor RpoD/SigA [Treponemataceae bacterium]